MKSLILAILAFGIVGTVQAEENLTDFCKTDVENVLIGQFVGEEGYLTGSNDRTLVTLESIISLNDGLVIKHESGPLGSIAPDGTTLLEYTVSWSGNKGPSYLEGKKVYITFYLEGGKCRLKNFTASR